jgi:hypothetical protein
MAFQSAKNDKANPFGVGFMGKGEKSLFTWLLFMQASYQQGDSIPIINVTF